MIKSAIEKLLSLATVEKIEIGGRNFTSRNVDEVSPLLIDGIKVHTLQAIVDFFDTSKPRDIDTESAMIHIVDPLTVKVVEAVADKTYRTRECYMTSTRIHGEFAFDMFMDQEKMVMNLMTMFVETPELLDVIKVVSGLMVESEAQVSDDGVSQEVKVRQGLRRIENVTIKNPVMLKPIRTFTEVDQVESPYVLRIKTESSIPRIAIFEAGGGQWKNEAITRIKAWLALRVGEAKILG